MTWLLAAGLLWLMWKLRRRRRRAARLSDAPLAGYDTGVRSPWGTPGPRMFRPHKGF